jgi:hypothetical protein
VPEVIIASCNIAKRRTMQKHIMYSLAATVLWGIWAVLVKISTTRIGHWPSILIYTLFSLTTVVILFFGLGQNMRQANIPGILVAGLAGILGGLALVFFHSSVSCFCSYFWCIFSERASLCPEYNRRFSCNCSRNFDFPLKSRQFKHIYCLCC